MLRLTVGHKLFLSVLLVSLIVIALIVGLTTWNLRQGFSTYLAQTELSRQSILVKRLEDVYAARGNWTLFKDDPAAWLSFIQLDQVSENINPKVRSEVNVVLDDWEASQRSAFNTSPLDASKQASFVRVQLVPGSPNAAAGSESGQRAPGPGPGPSPSQRAPQSAIDDCRGKQEGDEVWHRTRDGILRSTCLMSPEGLVARPNRVGQGHQFKRVVRGMCCRDHVLT